LHVYDIDPLKYHTVTIELWSVDLKYLDISNLFYTLFFIEKEMGLLHFGEVR